MRCVAPCQEGRNSANTGPSNGATEDAVEAEPLHDDRFSDSDATTLGRVETLDALEADLADATDASASHPDEGTQLAIVLSTTEGST